MALFFRAEGFSVLHAIVGELLIDLLKLFTAAELSRFGRRGRRQWGFHFFYRLLQIMRWRNRFFHISLFNFCKLFFSTGGIFFFHGNRFFMRTGSEEESEEGNEGEKEKKSEGSVFVSH